MAGQQYRVIADRDKGDDVDHYEWDAQRGDHVVWEVVNDIGEAEIVRIERPVSTEHCLSTAHHDGHEWGGHDEQPGTGYWCPGFDAAEEHSPTREQIADRLIERLRNSGGWPIDEVWQRWQNLFVEYDRDLVLALIQNGADR